MIASPSRIAVVLGAILLALLPVPLTAQALARKWTDIRNHITGGGEEETKSKMALDSAGNVFTAGRTDDGRKEELMLRKITTATGLAAWERSFVIEDSTTQTVVALATDPGGNLFVTGAVYRANLADYYVAKFAGGSGELLWQIRYDGPAGRDDIPTEIAVDSAGNPVVIGSSSNGTGSFSSNTDIHVVKFTAANGAIVWEKRFGGPVNIAQGRDLAIRANGNVVVCGQHARGLTAGRDLYLAEYSAATGGIVWETIFNSPDNSTEQVADLTLDPSGGVAVTGYFDPPGSGNRGMLTLKYSATGALQWERRVPVTTFGDSGARNIAADSAGNLIVLGFIPPTQFSPGTKGYLAKYAAATGAILWSQNVNLFQEYDSFGFKRLILDPAGNPCLTGNSTDSQGNPTLFTAKYSGSSGAKLWENNYTWHTGPINYQVHHGAYYIAIDAAGNLISHGNSTNPEVSSFDQFTIKYSPQGTRLWTNRYDGPWNRDEGPGSVTFDFAGDVLSTGYEVDPADDDDLVVRKQEGKTGATLWKFTYHGPVGMEDQGLAITSDSKGNAFVGGGTLQFVGGLGVYAVYFAKHAAADGQVIWQQPVTTPDNRSLRLLGIATGPDDNPVMVLTGLLSEDSDTIVIKFSGATGAVLWRQSYSGPTVGSRNYRALPRAIVMDSTGDLSVAMDVQESGNSTGDIRTVKFAGNSGQRLWEAIYNGPGPNYDLVRGIAADPAGNIAITGLHSTTTGEIAMFTALFRGTNGSTLWTKVYPGPDNNSQGTAVAMDSAGNVIAAGYVRESILPVFGQDAYIAKYAAADGALVWEQSYVGAPGGDERAEGIVIDSDNNAVVAGVSGEDTDTINGNLSIFIAKYSGANGASLGTDLHPAHIEYNRLPALGGRGIAIGPGDRIAVSGLSRPALTDHDVVTLLYEPQRPELELLGPAGQEVVSNSTVDFGFVPGAVHSSFTFTLRNGGNSDLTLGQIGLTGETAAFELIPPAGSTVAAGATKTFTIRAQSETVGPHAATLSIPSNDPDTNPFVVQLSFVTPSRNANLSSLATDTGDLAPAFSASRLIYRLTVPFGTSSLRLTPVAEDARATLTAGGTPVLSGSATSPIPLALGTTTVVTRVTAEDVRFTRDYAIQVTRLPEIINYQTGLEVPVSADGFVAGGHRVDFALAYPPLPGTTLAVVRNTGLEFIEGRFLNLGHGQSVILEHGGTSYRFVANYYGGSGNDLVLQWADTTAAGWGANTNGQLGEGDGSRAPWLLPAAVGGLPAGSTVFSLATGGLHSMGLTSDGAVWTWGSNSFGQLGDGTKLSRTGPGAVAATGALAGKRVISLAAGAFHSLALCSDGSVVAWGYNNYGQLGNGSTALATGPVAVESGGALAGRQVVAISAGAYHSLALCSDGGVVAWGFNGCGALGNGSTTGSTVPVKVLVPGGGPLRATLLSAGQYHNLATGDDGRIFAWGYNNHGQLGTGTTVDATLATALDIPSADGPGFAIATAIAAGGYHSFALFDDGGLAEWGSDINGSGSDLLLPVRIPLSGEIAGKQIVGLATGAEHRLALAADAIITAWGSNHQGQLGNGDLSPGAGPRSVLIPDGLGRPMTLARGSSASHTLILLGRTLPLPASQPGAAAVEPLSITGWRQLHFETSDNTGDAANEADSDHDGLVNLLEYAFALDPRRPDAGGLPRHRIDDGHIVIEFVEPAGVIGVSYAASSSRDLQADSWQPLTDQGIPPRHLFRIPMNQGAGFIRLEVTSP